MRKRREDLTEEVREAVVRDYLRGDKATIIQMKYKISPGEMYRILHRHNVKLRSSNQVSTDVPADVTTELLTEVSTKGTPVALLDLPFAMRIKELAEKVNEMTLQESFDQLYDILIEYLGADPVGTIYALFHPSATFTPKQVVDTATHRFLAEALRRQPWAEYLGDDRWRIKPSLQVGDEVRIRKNAPGYMLWYRRKKGTIVGMHTNDEEELRYLVKLPGTGAGVIDPEITLPFGEWELIKVKEAK